MNRRLFLFLCVYAVISLRGAVWHVSTTGSDDRSGLSWRHSFRSVGHALEVASPGDEIWIAAGCYEPAVSSGVIMPSGSFRLKSGVSLRGGFFGDERDESERRLIDRDGNGVVEEWEYAGETILRLPSGVGGTILDGVEAASIPTLLEGLTVMDGNAFGSEGGSLHPGEGGGAHLRGAYRVSRCEFSGNSAIYGGALWAEGGVEIESSFFSMNTAVLSGGAVRLSGEGASMANCVVLDNGDSALTSSGGGLSCAPGASGEILHCTFAGNSSRNAGSSVELSSGMWMCSSVVWGGFGHPQSVLAQNGALIDHCATESGGFPGVFAEGGVLLEKRNSGKGGVDVNENHPDHLYPCFSNPSFGDFRLGDGSSLIGRGRRTEGTPRVDAAGMVRPPTPSIGAYDSHHLRNIAIDLSLSAPLYFGLTQELLLRSSEELAESRLSLTDISVASLDGMDLTSLHAGEAEVRVEYAPAGSDASPGVATFRFPMRRRPISVAADSIEWNPGVSSFPELTWHLTGGELLSGHRLSGALSTYSSMETRGESTCYPITRGTLAVEPAEYSDDYEILFRNGVLTVFSTGGGEPGGDSNYDVGEEPHVAVEIVYGDTLDGASQIEGEFHDKETGGTIPGAFSWTQDGESLPCGIYELEWTFTPEDESLPGETGSLAVEIRPRPLYVCPYELYRFYRSENPETRYLLANFAPGEDETVVEEPPVLHVEAGYDSPVGRYPILMRGGRAPNYELVLREAYLEVAPLPLEVAIESASKEYGRPDPPFSWRILTPGFSTGSTPPFEVVREPGEVGGKYRIYARSLDSNYSVFGGDAYLTIGQVFPAYNVKVEPLKPLQTLRELQVKYEFLDPYTHEQVPGSFKMKDGYDLDTPRQMIPQNIWFEFTPDDPGHYYGVKIAPWSEIVGIPLTVKIDDKTMEYGEEFPEFTWHVEKGEILEGTELHASLRLKQSLEDAPSPLPPGRYRIVGSIDRDIVPVNYSYCYRHTSFKEGVLTIAKRTVFLIIEDKEYVWGEEPPEYTSYFSFAEDGSEPAPPGHFDRFDFSYQTSEMSDDGIAWITATGLFLDDNYQLRIVPGKLTRKPRLLTPVWPDVHIGFGDEVPSVTVTAAKEELPEGVTSLSSTFKPVFTPEDMKRYSFYGVFGIRHELPGDHVISLASDDTGDSRFRWDMSKTGVLTVGSPTILVSPDAEQLGEQGISVTRRLVGNDPSEEPIVETFTPGINFFPDVPTALRNIHHGGTVWIDEANGGSFDGHSVLDDVTLYLPYTFNIRRNHSFVIEKPVIVGNYAVRMGCIDPSGEVFMEGVAFYGTIWDVVELRAENCTFSSIARVSRISLKECVFRYYSPTGANGSSYALTLIREFPVTKSEVRLDNCVFKMEGYARVLSFSLDDNFSNTDEFKYSANWPIDMTTCTFEFKKPSVKDFDDYFYPRQGYKDFEFYLY